MNTIHDESTATTPRPHNPTSKLILHIVGARPQFVKLAPLSRALEGKCDQIILHTGQHYDKSMSESFFADLDIKAPDHNLEAGSGSQGAQTASMLIGIERICEAERPDLLIIYGDTNSTLAGALVGAKMGIKTAHVEACLRSFNRTMPEEINRIVADHTSDILLCPTQTAIDNAAQEGLSAKAFLVGDIMTDSVSYGLEKALRRSDVINEMNLSGESYYLLTLHRPYNVDSPENLVHILNGLDSLGAKVIFPVHPRTRKVIEEKISSRWQNITLVEPQAYLDFMMLHAHAKAMITDSGGVQKEAYLLSKPCITLRSETEWIETVEVGWNLLLDPHDPAFPNAIADFSPPAEHPELYGVKVSQAITDLILGA